MESASVCFNETRRKSILAQDAYRASTANFVKDYYSVEEVGVTCSVQLEQIMSNAYEGKMRSNVSLLQKQKRVKQLKKKCTKHFHNTLNKLRNNNTQTQRNECILRAQARDVAQYINYVCSAIAKGAVGHDDKFITSNYVSVGSKSRMQGGKPKNQEEIRAKLLLTSNQCSKDIVDLLDSKYYRCSTQSFMDRTYNHTHDQQESTTDRQRSIKSFLQYKAIYQVIEKYLCIVRKQSSCSSDIDSFRRVLIRQILSKKQREQNKLALISKQQKGANLRRTQKKVQADQRLCDGQQSNLNLSQQRKKKSYYASNKLESLFRPDQVVCKVGRSVSYERINLSLEIRKQHSSKNTRTPQVIYMIDSRRKEAHMRQGRKEASSQFLNGRIGNIKRGDCLINKKKYKMLFDSKVRARSLKPQLLK